MKIDLSTQRATPGQDIDITVSGKPNSFIGLLGVDQNAMMLKTGNDLNNAVVLDELDQYSQNYYPPEAWQRGKRFSFPYVETWSDFDVSHMNPTLFQRVQGKFNSLFLFCRWLAPFC